MWYGLRTTCAVCFTGDCGKLVKLPTLPNSSKVGGKLVWWVLINGLCPTVTHSALARVSLILHTFIVVDVVQLFLLLSPSWPKCVAQLAVARLVCRPLVCRPDGLSPRWLVTILSDPDPMSKYFFRINPFKIVVESRGKYYNVACSIL